MNGLMDNFTAGGDEDGTLLGTRATDAPTTNGRNIRDLGMSSALLYCLYLLPRTTQSERRRVEIAS